MIDKERFKDPVTGNFLTQSLFLEHGYDTDRAVYTLKDDDHEHKGVIYLSLKRLYLEMEDLGEHEFASVHLAGWRHWQRICNNKLFAPLIDQWREELEVKMRGRAIATIAKEADSGGRSALQAAKWLADRGWKKKTGRPSNADVQRETEIQAGIASEYSADVVRIKG